MSETSVIQLERALDRESVDPLLRDVGRALDGDPDRVVLDLAQVDAFDSAGVGAVLEGMRRAEAAGKDLRLRGLSGPMMEFFSLVSVDAVRAQSEPPRPEPWLAQIGAALWPALRVCAQVLGMARAVVTGVVSSRGRGIRLGRTAGEFDTAATGALPIALLIGFLLGLILAMQAWAQLRVWGADVFVANMVGVAVVTEIGPLMAAIILAARSASANAAQLGAMVVGEEIDALRQMGVDPIRFLVIPKVLALAAAAVVLTTLFIVVAIAGGALFGDLVAGIDLGVYIEQTRTALRPVDLAMALVKSAAFGLCAGVVSCALGLNVRGGPQGVARATTSAVVTAVFLVILVDTAMVAIVQLTASAGGV